MCRVIVLAFVCFVSSSLCLGQAPTEEQRSQLESKLGEWQQALTQIEQTWTRDAARHGFSYRVDEQECWSDLADLAVHAKAVEWQLRHDEFSKKSTVDHAFKVLAGADSLFQQVKGNGQRTYHGGGQICGYVSRVDHSVQPYAITLPADFNPETSARKRMPLYVVLHGRGGLNEAGFIAKHQTAKPIENQNWIQIDVFGRIDNAYRWAGETDVFEAIEDVSRRFAVDSRRITLWGFSMGGAGAWHLALHHPDRWSSAGAGAGFVDFYGYQNQSEKLPAYQDRPLRIYDTINYAANLSLLPFVTYGGDQDKQLQTSLMMQERAKAEKVPLKLIIGKDIGHKFTPEGAAEFQAFLAEHNQQGLPRYPGPRKIRFETYTPRYNQYHWLRIEELDELYEKSIVESSEVDQDGILPIATQNIRLMSVSRDIAEFVSLDDEPPLPLRDAAEGLLPSVYYQKLDAGWEVLSYDESRDYQENGQGRKRHGLQGPIDDAFMSSFICVRGTGKAWSDSHQAWADWTLQRFEQEFDKWMRGKIRIVNDVDVTPEMMEHSHLILFGDPGSNSLISKVIDQLPLNWTPEELEVSGTVYDASQHGVAMIYPSPLNPNKYIVLNSGMTTHEADFKASNSWLFPKLGDVAVLKFAASDQGFTESVQWADLFTGDWLLETSEQ